MTVDEQVSALQQSLAELQRQLRKQEKRLQQVTKALKAEEVPQLRAALEGIDLAVLQQVGMGEPAQACLQVAQAHVEELRAQQRRQIVRQLQTACEGAERTFQLLTEQPPEALVAPFTVVIDVERLDATLLFAREPLCTVAARAEAIMQAAGQQQALLEKHPVPAPQLFAQLRSAYRALLALQGKEWGDRIELADLLPLLSFVRQPKRFWQEPLREHFASYSKARFLYDLTRLRAQRMLEQDGLRLDLGTATGDSVRNKARVFFLPEADGSGQYYLSLRFVAAANVQTTALTEGTKA